MNLLLQWLAAEEWTSLVQALLHTLWLGGVAAGGLYFVLRRKTDPASRYRWCVGALLAVVLSGVVAWAVIQQPPATTHVAIQPRAVIVPIPPPTHAAFSGGISEKSVSVTPLRWTPWLALVWLCGLAAMLARAGSLVAEAQQVRRKSRPLDHKLILDLVKEARGKLGLARQIQVVVTEQLTSPAVMGVLKPVLILPLSMVTTLPMEQLQLILLHELAHVRRGDYLVNLCQLLAEALLFFNPAVWWISRQIRQEREACCDAAAIALAGGKLEYARTLAEVAGAALAAAPAFSDRRNPSGLKDRIQRLLVPGYRPALRLTWCALLAALLAGGGLLFLSAVGARATVAAILSPQQRIDRIEKKMAELGDKPVAENSNGDDEHAPTVKISGRIRAADGSPLPKWISLNLNSAVPRSSTGIAEMARDGKFTGAIRQGTIYVGAEVDGFAPACLGPLDGRSTNRFENLELVLERGYDAHLQVVDADTGRPLPGAKMSGYFSLRISSCRPRSWTSGPDGSVTLTHCADFPLAVTANAPGYEITQKTFDHVREGEPLRLRLRRGLAMAGVVLDKETGLPVPGAELHLLYQSGAAEMMRFDWNDALHRLGETDSHGRFAVNQLVRDGRYWIGITAPGHAAARLDDIAAGQNNLTARLGPELIVHGHIIGNAAWLGKADLNYSLYRSYSDVFADNSYGSGEWVPIEMDSGVARFQFTNRMAGPAKLSIDQKDFQREVDAPVADWVIDLSKADMVATNAPTRDVIFRFTHTSGVPPRGIVSIQIPDRRHPHNVSHEEDIEITNGDIRLQLPIGGTTSIQPRRLVGYWFSEWAKTDHGNLTSVPVTDGKGPMVIEVPVIPAGAIYANARDADGTPAGGLFFGVIELKRAPGRDELAALNNNEDSISDNLPRRWVSGPLPLGGEYQIYGWRGNSFCLSRTVTLTEAQPDAEVALKFPPSQAVDGVVLDADKAPLRDAELKVLFTLAGNHAFDLKHVFTDEHGKFRIENLTPDCGEYSIEADAPGIMAERVKLKAGPRPQVIRLKRGRTMAGRVVEASSNHPIPNLEVRVFNYEGAWPVVTARTDDNGRFAFTTLSDVEYHLIIGDAEMLSNPDLRADGRTNLLVPVKLYAWSKAKPKAP